MGVTVVPTATGGGIKSVQRGLAGASGTVTITAVDITKSFVTVFGTASSGSVAGSGSVSAQNGTVNAMNGQIAARQLFLGGGTNYAPSFANGPYNGTGSVIGQFASATKNYNAPAANLNFQAITGGTNNLVTAIVQGYLSNSTSLIVSGACRWEVVEFA